MDQPFPEIGHDHGHCRSWVLRRAESVCQEKGLRLTPQRRDVLEILSGSHQCMGAYDILEHMDHHQRRPPPAAVYRSLEFLMGLGLIHRMAGRNAYFACTRPDHGNNIQFWICRSCGVVGETESREIAEAIPRLAQAIGFRLATVNVEIEGECSICLKE